MPSAPQTITGDPFFQWPINFTAPPLFVRERGTGTETEQSCFLPMLLFIKIFYVTVSMRNTPLSNELCPFPRIAIVLLT